MLGGDLGVERNLTRDVEKLLEDSAALVQEMLKWRALLLTGVSENSQTQSEGRQEKEESCTTAVLSPVLLPFLLYDNCK